MKESDILYEERQYTVRRVSKNYYEVCEECAICAVVDSAYAEESLAIARAKYLAKQASK